MSRPFQRLLHFLNRRMRSDRKIATVETSVPGSTVPPPAMTSGRRPDAAAYRAALTGLPPERRELFELHQIDGLTFIEIAERRGIAAAEVEREIAAALGYLAIRLQGEGRGVTAPPSD